MSKDATVRTSDLPKQAPVISKNEGQLNGRKISKGFKPLFIVLILLGIFGIGAAGVGMAAFGGHQGWWDVGALKNLSQFDSLLMTSIGGGVGTLLLIGGIIGIIKNNAHKPIGLKAAYIAQDASYPHQDDSGNLDLVYCNKELGFGCVIDGTGHNNPRMQNALKQHFDPFIEGYAKGLKKVSPSETPQYFAEQVKNLEKQFRNRDLPLNQEKVCPVTKVLSTKDENDVGTGTFLDATYKPAMSFVQLVPLKDRLHLLIAQADDTMIVVEMANGKLLTNPMARNAKGYGVGDQSRNVNIINLDITGAKRVIGFSDGIGEFITFKELEGIVANTKSDGLFNKLKEKAISQRQNDPNERAANGARLKSFNPNDEGSVDDMSLFVLEI